MDNVYTSIAGEGIYNYVLDIHGNEQPNFRLLKVMNDDLLAITERVAQVIVDTVDSLDKESVRESLMMISVSISLLNTYYYISNNGHSTSARLSLREEQSRIKQLQTYSHLLRQNKDAKDAERLKQIAEEMDRVISKINPELLKGTVRKEVEA